MAEVLDAPSGLRARKKDRTRAQIHSTALRLFSEHGYPQVTIDDVAAACDVSRATVFRYFATKEDLVVGDNEWLADLRDCFACSPPGQPVLEVIRAALHTTAERYVDDALHERLVKYNRLITDNGPLLARALELQMACTQVLADLFAVHARGEGAKPETRERVLASAVMGALHVAKSQWLEDDGRSNLRVLADRAISVLGEGFAGL